MTDIIKVALIGHTYGMGTRRLVELLKEVGVQMVETAVAMERFGNAAELIIDDQVNFGQHKYLMYKEFSTLNENAKTNFTPSRADGWYHQFEKPNGKRNKKL